MYAGINDNNMEGIQLQSGITDNNFSRKKSDYEHKLNEIQNERNSYDKSIGFKTCSSVNVPSPPVITPQTMLPPANSSTAINQICIHPVILKMFLDMDDTQRDVLKSTQYDLYMSIVKELSKKQDNIINAPAQAQAQAQAQTQAQAPQQLSQYNYTTAKGNFDIDFRNNLFDCNKYTYSVNINTNIFNIIELTLYSIQIPRVYNIENEPYLYLAIDNIKNNAKDNIFGKLILKKVVNGFMIYTPENCSKSFSIPESFTYLNISLLNNNHKKIILNGLPIIKIKKTSTSLLLTSASPHYLTIGDKINMIKNSLSNIICCVLEIIEIIDSNNFITNNNSPIDLFKDKPDLSFEKIDIKVSMTFNYVIIE